MRSLVWFTQDLRLIDNPTITAAHDAATEILHVGLFKEGA